MWSRGGPKAKPRDISQMYLCRIGINPTLQMVVPRDTQATRSCVARSPEASRPSAGGDGPAEGYEHRKGAMEVKKSHPVRVRVAKWVRSVQNG